MQHYCIQGYSKQLWEEVLDKVLSARRNRRLIRPSNLPILDLSIQRKKMLVYNLNCKTPQTSGISFTIWKVKKKTYHINFTLRFTSRTSMNLFSSICIMKPSFTIPAELATRHGGVFSLSITELMADSTEVLSVTSILRARWSLGSVDNYYQ